MGGWAERCPTQGGTDEVREKWWGGGGGGMQQELEEVNAPTRTFALRNAGAPDGNDAHT